MKNKEWLKNKIEIMGSETSENYPHEQVVNREVVLNLINQLDEPEKIVIPQFVADWWERDNDSVTMYGRLRVEKKHKFDLISIFYDKGLGDYLSKVEDWFYENGSSFLDLVNGKAYKVEKEKLYVVELINNHPALYLAYDLVDKVFFISRNQEEILNIFKKRFTEKEIKDYDERYWPFTVEVTE